MIPTADTPMPIATNDTNEAFPTATTSNSRENTGERKYNSFKKNATKINSLIITNNSTNFKYKDLPEETFV